jgi:recombination protein RecT
MSKEAQPNQAMVRIEESKRSLQAMLDKVAPQLSVMIPERYRAAVSPQRMALLTLTTFSKNEQLQKCTLPSIVRALLDAARVGLEPDGQFGQGWLMPVWNAKKGVHEAQFRIGYQGRKTLTFRAGNVADIIVDVVCEGDDFDESTILSPNGLARDFKHKPKRSKERGALKAAYAIAIFKDGSAPHLTVLDATDIERIKKRSESLKGNYPERSPWSTDEPEMWKKSAVARLCKELPQPDPIAAQAFERDEAIEAGEFDSPEDDADLPEEVVVEAAKTKFVAPAVPKAARGAAKAAAPPAGSAPPAQPTDEPPFDAPVDAEFEELPSKPAAEAPAEQAPEVEPAQGDICVDIRAAKSSKQLRELGKLMGALPPTERQRAAPVFNERMSELLAAEKAGAQP